MYGKRYTNSRHHNGGGANRGRRRDDIDAMLEDLWLSNDGTILSTDYAHVNDMDDDDVIIPDSKTITTVRDYKAAKAAEQARNTYSREDPYGREVAKYLTGIRGKLTTLDGVKEKLASLRPERYSAYIDYKKNSLEIRYLYAPPRNGATYEGSRVNTSRFSVKLTVADPEYLVTGKAWDYDYVPGDECRPRRVNESAKPGSTKYMDFDRRASVWYFDDDPYSHRISAYLDMSKGEPLGIPDIKADLSSILGDGRKFSVYAEGDSLEIWYAFEWPTEELDYARGHYTVDIARDGASNTVQMGDWTYEYLPGGFSYGDGTLLKDTGNAESELEDTLSYLTDKFMEAVDKYGGNPNFMRRIKNAIAELHDYVS